MASTGGAGIKVCGLCVSGTDGGVEGTATGRKGGVDRLVSMTRGKAEPRLTAGPYCCAETNVEASKTLPPDLTLVSIIVKMCVYQYHQYKISDYGVMTRCFGGR